VGYLKMSNEEKVKQLVPNAELRECKGMFFVVHGTQRLTGGWEVNDRETAWGKALQMILQESTD